MDKELHELYNKDFLKEKPIMEQSLYEYLNDEYEYNKLYFIKLAGIKEAREHNTKAELQLDIIENEIIGILQIEPDKRTEDETQILLKAKKYYSKFYTINPLCAISCRLYDDEIAKELFTKESYEELKKFKDEIILKVEKYYKKYISNEKLEAEETEILFEYLTKNIGVSNNNLYQKQEKMIRYLLLKEENYPLVAKKFLIKYISYKKCKKLGLPNVKIYIGNKDPWEEKHNTHGCSFDKEKIILIDEEYLKESPTNVDKDNIENRFNFIKTINHEVEHYKQVCYTQRNLVSESTINYIKSNLFRKYFSSKSFDEYEHNYEHREIEIEANIAGWRDSVEVFNEYAPNKLNQNIFRASELPSKNRTYAYYQKDEKSFVIPIDSNISLLKEIILRHPKELDNYQQLLYFFDSKGRLRDMNELIKGYQTILLSKDYSEKEKKDFSDAYQEFFRYKLINSDLKEINLDKMTDSDQNILFSIITEEFEIETKKLKDMMDVYNDVDPREIKIVTDTAYGRIKRIKKYYDYLLKNKKNIYNSSKNTKFKEFEILDLRELSSILKSLKFNLSTVEGTDLGDEIVELSKYGKKK